MDYLENKIKEYKPNIKQSSLSAYLQNIRRIFKMLDLDPTDNLNELLDKDKIDDLFKDRKYTTIRNVYNSIIVSLQALDADPVVIGDYINHRDKYNNDYSAWSSKNEKSPTQAENWISMEEVNKVVEYWKAFDIQKHLLLRLFIKYPFRNNMRNLKIITYAKYKKLTQEQKLNKNFFIKRQRPLNYWFSFNDYKTHGKYGERFMKIDDEFTREIGVFLRKKKPVNFLFEDEDNNELSTNDFTRYFKTLFKETNKQISTTLLRHIIVSDAFGENKKEQTEMAEKMGHSLNMSNDYIKY